MKLISFVNRLLRKRNVIKKNDWESQYIDGKWNYLTQLNELAHYSVITGYFNYFKYGGALLDVGCGEGILYKRTCSSSYSKYVGIDISKEAVNRAMKNKNEKTTFIQTDLYNYSTTKKFDAIIFNEVLYYLNNQVEVLKRYDRFLKNDGIFIISMYHRRRNAIIWKDIESIYIPFDETIITNRLKISWLCKVYRSSKFR
jgi:2-polyprenyl-3-methyl-5-hydroxy-6-metoxy-1,4-benzoquinol methylase